MMQNKRERYSERFKSNLNKKNIKHYLEFFSKNASLDNENDLIQFHILESIYHCIFGNTLNIFIDTNNLFNFLINTEIKDLNVLFNFIEKYSQKKEKNKKTFNIKEKKINLEEIYTLFLIIHHKNKKYNSVLFTIKYDFFNKEIVNYFSYSGNYEIEFVMLGAINNINDINNNDNIIEKKISTNLLINLLHYINAFPECLINQPPDEIAQHNHYKGIKRKLTTHESLIDRSGVTPHFRRGHFRYLDNDYYKNKKGQTVFVSSCFVKGEAKTVIDNKKYNLEI